MSFEADAMCSILVYTLFSMEDDDFNPEALVFTSIMTLGILSLLRR